MATYTDMNRTVEVKQVANLNKTEVRLFLYFLLKSKGEIPKEKAAKFQLYLDQGNLPEEMGMITRKKKQAFCIRETHPSYYTVYVSMDEEACFSKKIQRILTKVNK